MSRFKLVVSDFHIGSGPLTEEGEVNPLEYFIYDPRFISFLDYYSSGPFREAEVELILNGDILNTLQVDYHEEFPAEVTEEIALEKTRKIFAGHPELFDALAAFAKTPGHRITYIHGNHDPALLFPAVQDELCKRLDADIAFPGFSYHFDGVWVEHGHQYTSANRFNPAEPFTMNAKGEKVLALPWGCLWVIQYLNEMKKERSYIDRVQPFERYLLLALFFDPWFAVPALVKLIGFFARQRFSGGKWKSREELKKTWRLLSELSLSPSLVKEAKTLLARPGVHTVIFGHTHQPVYRRFGRDRLYVNTGTWNDIIHLDIQNLGRTRRMTYAFIDYPEGRKPRTRLKIWKGTRQTEEDVIF